MTTKYTIIDNPEELLDNNDLFKREVAKFIKCEYGKYKIDDKYKFEAMCKFYRIYKNKVDIKPHDVTLQIEDIIYNNYSDKNEYIPSDICIYDNNILKREVAKYIKCKYGGYKIKSNEKATIRNDFRNIYYDKGYYNIDATTLGRIISEVINENNNEEKIIEETEEDIEEEKDNIEEYIPLDDPSELNDEKILRREIAKYIMSKYGTYYINVKEKARTRSEFHDIYNNEGYYAQFNILSRIIDDIMQNGYTED